MKAKLMLEETPRQTELRTAAQDWRDYAETAKPEGLKRVCLSAASALEQQARTGIAVCACCHKPFSGGMRF